MTTINYPQVEVRIPEATIPEVSYPEPAHYGAPQQMQQHQQPYPPQQMQQQPQTYSIPTEPQMQPQMEQAPGYAYSYPQQPIYPQQPMQQIQPHQQTFQQPQYSVIKHEFKTNPNPFAKTAIEEPQYDPLILNGKLSQDQYTTRVQKLREVFNKAKPNSKILLAVLVVSIIIVFILAALHMNTRSISCSPDPSGRTETTTFRGTTRTRTRQVCTSGDYWYVIAAGCVMLVPIFGLVFYRRQSNKCKEALGVCCKEMNGGDNTNGLNWRMASSLPNSRRYWSPFGNSSIIVELEVTR